MDTFSEELVIKKNDRKDIAKLVLYLLAIFSAPALFLLLGSLVNPYFVIVAICAFFFAIYGSYYLVTGLYREFEYAVTNSNITIDKVIAKRNRKRVISVDIKRFNTLRKYKESDVAKKKYKKIFNASITADGDDVYAAELHLDKFGGECLLLFSPSEKTLEAMRPYLKNTIKLELFKSNAKKSVNANKKTEPEKQEKSSAKDNENNLPENKHNIKGNEKQSEPKTSNDSNKNNNGSSKKKKSSKK